MHRNGIKYHVRVVIVLIFATAALQCLPGIVLAQKKGGGTTPPPNPEIAFSDNGIRVMNADGTNARTVVSRLNRNDSMRGPCWSADGTVLTFHRILNGDQGIWNVNLDGSGLTKIVSLPDNRNLPAFTEWSRTPAPDGRYKILFHAYGASVTTPMLDIFIVNPDGTGLTNLTRTSDEWEMYPSWSHDGSRLMYWRDVIGGYELVELSLGLDSVGNVAVISEQVLYFKPGEMPSFTKMSNTLNILSYSESDSPYMRVHLLDLATMTTRLLTSSSTWDERWATFSPDDSKIAFHRDGIYTINVDGTGETRIASRGADPFWRRSSGY